MPTDSMKRKTLYRRQLPPPCIGFSSPDGRKIFREALLEGNMEMYFRLAEQFRTQDDPAFCGLSTLTMVLNALAVDPGRVWKGPWRWYHESMLDCCAPLETVREKGVTFDTMVCLARCNGLEVERGGPKTHSLEDLRAVITECSSKDDGKVIVVSYDRKGLKQTGSGHFSPIGGYSKAQDLVLILDTARFKLPPHWVPLELLWEAMKSLDKVTGRPRGFMVLKKSHNLTHRLFTANKDIYEEWPQVASWVKETIELASVRRDGLSRADPDSGKEFRAAATMADFIEPLLERMSPQAASLLTTLNNTMADPLCQTGKAQDGVILQAIQGTDAYQEVKKFTLKSGSRFRSSSSGSEEELIMSTLTSPVCPEESECGCSSRHSIAIMTYALLSMLHKRDFGEDCDAGDSKEVVGGHLWREDPVGNLPENVVEEAMHVAGMLTGLVTMKTA